MDELTIGDKTYISSKRAAQITGYAKDYVGQLCREGRVEARLVGRNWYVLEEAIREHRFGAEEAVEDVLAEVVAEEALKISPIAAWESPQYVPEAPTELPPVSREPATAPPAVAEMQSAWQEWFKNRPQPIEEVVMGQDDASPEPVFEPEEEEPVALYRMPDPEPVYEEIVHEPVHRSGSSFDVVAHEPVETEVMDLTPRQVPQAFDEEVAYVSSRLLARQEAVRRSPTERGSSLIAKTILISLAGVAIAVAAVGSGYVERFVGGDAQGTGPFQGAIRFLEGASSYESIKQI